MTALLLAVHVLAGAAWFGAMLYSLIVLQPRLRQHFGQSTEREALILTLSHGARWHVLAAMAVVALTGAGAALGRWPDEPSTAWRTLLAFKIGLFLTSVLFFWRISWYWWPQRLFARVDELPALETRYRRGGAVMLLLVGANIVLGVLAHVM